MWDQIIPVMITSALPYENIFTVPLLTTKANLLSNCYCI